MTLELCPPSAWNRVRHRVEYAIKKVLKRFGHIKRLIVVADRGLLSLDNLDELGKIKLPSGQPLEFILAVPGRRHGEFVDVLQAFEGRATRAEQELIEEASWHDLRLVVAHHPQRTETSAAQTRPAKSVDKDNYSDVR